MIMKVVISIASIYYLNAPDGWILLTHRVVVTATKMITAVLAPPPDDALYARRRSIIVE